MLGRLPVLLCLLTLPARAVVVRGLVTTALGKPVPGARVQLILGPRSVGEAVSGGDGSYEIRSALRGRFVLLTSRPGAHSELQIGPMFYAGRTDEVVRDVALDASYVTPQVSAVSTLVERPLAQLATPVTQVAADQLLPHATLLPLLRELPSAVAVEHGTLGTGAELYVRGAAPETTRVEVDGVSAENLGGGFDFATLGTTGLAMVAPTPAVELAPGALPLRLVDAAGAVLATHAAAATGLRPTLTYAGDAGNLAIVRHEGTATLLLDRLDLFAGYARLETDSGQPVLSAHLASASANVGYHISAGSSLRATLRQDILAAPLDVPAELYTAAPAGRRAAQNVYGAATFATSTRSWHMALRYGLIRKRGQTQIVTRPVQGIVTVTGANGDTASGIPLLPVLPAREDAVTNRDEAGYQGAYTFRRWLSPAWTVRYQDERAADLATAQSVRLGRTHVSFAGGLAGQLLHDRVFYEASGLVDRSPTFGLAGAPQLGLTYVPVEPGARRFRGTALHASAATGFREPTLAEQASVPQAVNPRSRTLSLGLDQVLLPAKLNVRATYFRSRYSHEFAPIARLGLLRPLLSQSLATREQGLELTAHYQPFARLYLAGGYTYLASLVEQAPSPPASSAGIGEFSAVTGARAFHRPPQTGFFTLAYTGTHLSATFDGALVGRSDSSTGEGAFAPAAGSGLLLPNRDLSPGHAALNASAAYVLGRHITVETQMTNLLDNRHMAPLGYASTPFAIRTGLRLRLGGE